VRGGTAQQELLFGGYELVWHPCPCVFDELRIATARTIIARAASNLSEPLSNDLKHEKIAPLDRAPARAPTDGGGL
jgi:hypothetical protein